MIALRNYTNGMKEEEERLGFEESGFDIRDSVVVE